MNTSLDVPSSQQQQDRQKAITNKYSRKAYSMFKFTTVTLVSLAVLSLFSIGSIVHTYSQVLNRLNYDGEEIDHTNSWEDDDGKEDVYVKSVAHRGGEGDQNDDPFDYFKFDSEQERIQRDPMMDEGNNVDLSAHQRYSYPSDPTRDDDKDCPFIDSSLYRSVYVYPSWMNETDGWHGPILSEEHNNIEEWPWLYEDRRAKEGRFGHYGGASNQMGQYTLELIVRELMTHPNSCLRTMNPMKATLFYVPYLPSTEFHKGKTYVADYSTSPYAAAIAAAIDGDYTQWERLFGLTSDFWKRKKGADHILVFSEPLHGLSHPRNKRGSYHFINTQKMLTPPIIISVEVSTSFVKKYPMCSAKNIVVPYPNPDGNWFNGAFDREFFDKWNELLKSKSYLQAESETVSIAAHTNQSNTLIDIFQPRPVAQYYSAGLHGTCTQLRKNMNTDYHCTASSKAFSRKVPHNFGMRASTFCPCPGGDSPSAKRMFDSVNAGCIPVILSYDYVWPYTSEADPSIPLDPSLFSIRWDTAGLWDAKHNYTTCEILPGSKPSVQARIEQMSKDEITRLRKGLKKASYLYSYWNRDGYNGSEFPLVDGILPDGGASMALIKLLSIRAGGSHWPQCEQELATGIQGGDPNVFIC